MGEFLYPLNEVVTANSFGEMMRGLVEVKPRRPCFRCLMKPLFQRTGAQMHEWGAFRLPTGLLTGRHTSGICDAMTESLPMHRSSSKGMTSTIGTSEYCPKFSLIGNTELGLGPSRKLINKKSLVAIETLIVEPWKVFQSPLVACPIHRSGMRCDKNNRRDAFFGDSGIYSTDVRLNHVAIS
jgi:hypothetical protein